MVSGCICKGNWRDIISETEHLIGRKFIDSNNNVCTLFGIVHGKDDYYYGIWYNDHKTELLSCVGNIESWGLMLIEETIT
jgi:hypothetical protein